MMEDQVSFPVGNISLEGLLSLPSSAPKIGVVICHPHPLYGGDMHNNVVTALANAFQDAGHATLRFNFRGVGRSTGTHDDGNAEMDDVKGAVTFMLSRLAVPVVAVAGYSFGSIVGLRAGAADPRVHKLIGVALPIARRDASFLTTVAKPKLLITGDRDDIAPAQAMTTLFSGIAAPKTLIIVDGADHFFGGSEHEVAEPAVAFLGDELAHIAVMPPSTNSRDPVT